MRRIERIEMLEVPVRRDEMFVPIIARNGDSRTVAVYTRHKPECPNKGNPYWRKCRCTKYLYIYANGASRQISAQTRSWEKAEERAQEIRESFDPAKQFQQDFEAKTATHSGGVEITQATDEFMKEIERLNREKAIRKKYKLTLARLSIWCAAQSPPVFLLSQLNVPTLRRWVLSWPGAPPRGTTSISASSHFFTFALDRDGSKKIRQRESRTYRPSKTRLFPSRESNTKRFLMPTPSTTSWS
jgi:hypothetical protein